MTGRDATTPDGLKPGDQLAAIRSVLETMPLRAAYLDEQRELQPDVQEALERSLPGRGVTISVGGTGKPSLRLLGTSFWPDVVIGAPPDAAIEIKLIRPGQGASKALAETIGQALIYSARYPIVFAFVVHFGRMNSAFVDTDDAVRAILARNGIELVIRRPGDSAPAVIP